MSGAKRPDIPPAPSPLPTPIIGRETAEAKKRARKRSGGRADTILAGRMMAERDTGNKLKGILG